MALTLSQMFMAAITIGIGAFRGTETNLSFHVEGLLGHANDTATTVASGHARAADAIANDNVISASIMGPRFAVEADNITMMVNAMIACPQVHNPYMQKICAEFHANDWRALAKLAWVRAEQAMLWGALGQLSSDIDRVTSIRQLDQATSRVRSADSAVSVRIEDPATQGSIWGSDNTGEACSLAEQDSIGSPMPGAAFPVLMENLLEGLPKALVQMMPRIICGVESAASGGGGGGGGGSGISLPQVPSVAEATAQDCARLQQEMQCQLAGTCNGLTQQTITPWQGGSAPNLSSDVSRYVSCNALSCSFDSARCQQDRLEANSTAYLTSIGLSPVPVGASGAASRGASLGGATHAPTDANWNHADSFRACAFTSKPVNGTVTGIADSLRKLVSFGTAQSTSTLQNDYEYESCAKWYFPDGGESPFASVPHEQQPFVAAWTFALVAPRR